MRFRYLHYSIVCSSIIAGRKEIFEAQTGYIMSERVPNPCDRMSSHARKCPALGLFCPPVGCSLTSARYSPRLYEGMLLVYLSYWILLYHLLSVRTVVVLYPLNLLYPNQTFATTARVHACAAAALPLPLPLRRLAQWTGAHPGGGRVRPPTEPGHSTLRRQTRRYEVLCKYARRRRRSTLF